jgi:carbamate kinase
MDEAKEYIKAGEFPAGSMGPKVMAAVSFIENGGAETIITEASQLSNPGCGTRITAN